MIQKPRNWESVQAYTDRQELPLDAYVCKVQKVAITYNADYGDQLCILYDIVEGEYKDYYRKDFDGNTNDNKKWRGVLRVWIPRDNDTKEDEWTKRTFKGLITSFEKSNAGFTFNWEEQSLVGKLFGVLYRNEEYEVEDRRGWAVRPFRAISVDSVRDETFRLPKDKPLKNRPAHDDMTLVASDDLPF